MLKINIMLKEQKIYLFIPYFGSFPNYFQLYLNSLGINRDILVVFIITDIDVSKYNLPDNAIIVNMNIQNIKDRIRNFLYDQYNTFIEPSSLLVSNYKLVDFKIIYSLLFNDIIVKYNITQNDFVGWGDIDVIYGKLSNFINFNDNYNIIGGFHGHFTAIQNNLEFKNLFKRIPNYFDLCTNQKVYITDEIAYRDPLNSFLKENNYKMFYMHKYFCDIVPPCFYHLFRPDHITYSNNFFNVAKPEKNISHLYFDIVLNKLMIIYDDNETSETTYCHLQKRNMELCFDMCDNNNGYYIEENKFTLSKTNTSVVPLNIYTTWFTKNLPTEIQQNFNDLKSNNPEFNVYLFDNNECYNFIKQHFPIEFSLAFECLIPSTFKTDLWKMCVLYVYGGIYIDIELKCVNDFKLINLTDKEYFVNDGNFTNNGITYKSVYNGLISCKPKNEILLKSIIEIVFNVSKKKCGNTPYSVTGSHLIGKLYSYICANSQLYISHYGPISSETIVMNKKIILKYCNNYQKENYANMWKKQNIFNNEIKINLEKIIENKIWSENYINHLLELMTISNNKIRLHLPAIPYTITRDEYSHDAFTGKVKRFAPMMKSVDYEVYHYGVETSDSGADKDIQLFSVDEWNRLRIDSMCYIDSKLSRDEAEKKINNETTHIGILANYTTPLFKEFNKRFREKLCQNYRNTQTDIVCVPLGRSYDDAINDLNVVVVEFGIGYSGSCKKYRVFESNNWLSNTVGKENIHPPNYWFVVPYSFDISEFVYQPIPKNKSTIGFLGRIESVKGCNIIIEIAKRFPNIQFILCGQGDYAQFIKEPNITYKQPICGKERSEYLGNCIATLCPSKYLEPFCASAVESQLCGTPVICSDFGGFTETVEQFKTGVRCHTLADYCYGVQLAINGEFDRKYISERARNLYDMYKLARNYDYIFKSVLDIHIPEKNGWYSPDTHIKKLI